MLKNKLTYPSAHGRRSQSFNLCIYKTNVVDLKRV